MGLTADLAATRLHVLPVAVPGLPLLHLSARAAVRVRGWALAATPADADVLLVCGPVAGELAEAVDRVWRQVPAPRALRRVETAAELAGALDSAARVVADVGAQREALRRAVEQVQVVRAPHEHVQRAQVLQRESSMERADDGTVAGEGGSMPGPAGIPLADGWDGDRDGLEMDVLRLRIGPVLPDWPAGLVVDCALSGDVVVDAAARLLPAPVAEPEDGGFAQACERAARLLRLAGWAPPALRLERALDRVLAGAPAADAVREVRRVAVRVSRSALLRWGLRGAAVDVRARLLVILGDAERAALGEPPVDAPLDPDALAGSLVGRGFAEARLLIAAAGPVEVPVDA